MWGDPEYVWGRLSKKAAKRIAQLPAEPVCNTLLQRCMYLITGGEPTEDNVAIYKQTTDVIIENFDKFDANGHALAIKIVCRQPTRAT
jgi:hypothetical protein